VSLNGSRKVQGTLRGYDVYLNVVLDEAVEEKKDGGKERLGMVVIRGNAVVMLEVRISAYMQHHNPADLIQALDRINTDDHRGGGGRH
jgi:small nuclear ribonucleoprotein G